ncbi:hypothetical protein AX16_009846 [Volvariella volvacea WC 439]|nr:hypothetical protein AX16_009846 [Volvariella volvacea WC 439]
MTGSGTLQNDFRPPPFYKQTNRRALQDEIDERLKSPELIDDERRLLHTQWNQLAPIFCLPVEILIKITCFSALDPSQHADSFQAVYGQHLTLSSVCRDWREIALWDHTLWTDIRSSYLGLAPMLIERSGNAPLSFQLLRRDQGPLFLKAIDLVSKQRHRIQTLRLTLRHIGNHPLSFLTDSAPLMVHFELEGLSTKSPPYSLFNGSAPLLTTLILRVNFDWNMPLLHSIPNLQRLKITGHELVERPSWDRLITILRSMPELRTLFLDRSLPLFNSSHLLHAIQLPPRFVALHLCDNPFSSYDFLNHATTDLPLLQRFQPFTPHS